MGGQSVACSQPARGNACQIRRSDKRIIPFKKREIAMTFATAKATRAVCGLGLLITGSVAWADAGHQTNINIGQSGDISKIDHEIDVELGEMFFKPDAFEFNKGETVKFVLSNTGGVVHEFAIGNDEMHDNHAVEMRVMMSEGMIRGDTLDHAKMAEAGMMHMDSNSRLLEPGETVEMVWTFSGVANELRIACTLPGHREGGMEATITIAGGE